MENNFLLDVRTPDEFSLNTLPGAVNIPLDELRDVYKRQVHRFIHLNIH